MAIPFVQFLFYGIPEGIIIMWAIQLFSNNRVTTNKLMVTGLLLAIFEYLIRFLPIMLGVNTLFNLFVAGLLSIYINKVPIFKAIRYAFVTIVLVVISEIILYSIYVSMLNINQSYFSNDIEPLVKVALLLPNIPIFIILILLLKCILKRFENRVKQVQS